MKKSEIKLVVELDKDQVPERIFWDADDKDKINEPIALGS